MLKASCTQGALHEILQIISRGVSGRSTQPVQNNIFVSTADNTLRLVATDLEYISLDAQVPAMVTEEGKVTVPGRVFNEIVTSLPAEEVSLESEQVGELTIRCGKSNYRVRGLPADDFQMLPEVMPEAEFSVPEGALRTLLAQTVFACSPDETRPILTGALLNVKPDMLTVVATDTYRMGIRTLRVETGIEAEKKVIVSSKVLGELMRILREDSEEPVKVSLSGRLVEFEAHKVKISSRLIEGEYPNYEKIIPAEFTKKMTVQVEALERSLRRALIVARQDNNRVVLRGQEGILQITAASPDLGSVEEEVEMELEGDPVEIAFNVRFMLDMLEAAGSQQVIFSLSGPLNPGTIRPAGRDDYIYLVMPMQIIT
ncbi:MAG TPA: DNA polymerase III subunit beta [Armatimonadota bacterium]|jgi:DNA polymerase-3 subunit beta